MSAVIRVKPPSDNKISATLREAFECVKIRFPFPHDVYKRTNFNQREN